jgi:streptomycin 6-kinase
VAGRVAIPSSLDWCRETPAGRAWLARLPSLVEECAARWDLDPGEPFRGGNVSLTLPARRPDGSEAVLKLNYPDEESAHEADALAFWDGRGAVRLLAADAERGALLLERCRPGDQLWSVEDDREATTIAAGMLLRIWREPPAGHPFRSLASEAARWRRELAGSPLAHASVDPPVLAEALEALAALPRQPGRPVVLHQDFHGGNVIRSTREPWLVIDPKPLAGERAFDAASLLRDRRWLLSAPGAGRIVRRRLDQLTDLLGLDRERLRLWGIAHALAWGVDEATVEADMLHAAKLLHEAR